MNHLWAGYGTWGILSSSCADGQVQTSIYMYTIHMYIHILCTHINILTNGALSFSAKLGRRVSKLLLSGFAWVTCASACDLCGQVSIEVYMFIYACCICVLCLPGVHLPPCYCWTWWHGTVSDSPLSLCHIWYVVFSTNS